MPRIPDDFPLTGEQLAQLAGYGICFIHTHPKEDLGFSDILELMAAAPITTVSGVSSYTVIGTDMILLVDATSSDVTIHLPVAVNGREFYVVKIAGLNNVYVVPSSGEKVLDSTSGIVFSATGSSVRLKSVLGHGYWIL